MTPADWIKRIQYKPIVKFHVEFNDGYWELRLLFHVPDSYNPGKLVEICHFDRTRGGSFKNFEQFKSYVYERILMAERHETDEWFKVDGIAERMPHGNDLL